MDTRLTVREAHIPTFNNYNLPVKKSGNARVVQHLPLTVNAETTSRYRGNRLFLWLLIRLNAISERA